MRFWYVRRGVSWAPLLASCVLGAVAAVAVGRWPGTAGVLLPASLALATAGAAFLFDEPATPVVAVSPRGAGWRWSSRVGAAVVPLGTWVAIVLFVPTGVGVHRPSWALAGLAALSLVVGGAAWCSRHEVDDPGSAVAAAVVGAQLVPLVLAPVAGWQPMLPLSEFGTGLVWFWAAVAAVGLGLVAWAFRPGLRRAGPGSVRTLRARR